MQKYVVGDKILSDLKSGDEETANIDKLSAFESLANFMVRNINGTTKL